jgi:hypothetical protein
MKAIKILFLVVLAIVASPVGIVYSFGESLFFIASDVLRSIWRAIYDFFRDVSIIVSVTASKFLNRLLMDSGVPFGNHSVSAVLGANQRERTLTGLGLWLTLLLDSIEKNHCRKASERAGI